MEAQDEFNDLAEEASVVGLQLHFGKTKIISNMQARRGVSRAAKHVRPRHVAVPRSQ